MLTSDLAIYEVSNSIWKHQFLLGDIEDGALFLSIFVELVDSGAIGVVPFSKEMLQKTYGLASKHRLSVYDATFLCLAVEAGLGLKTLDGRLSRIFSSEAKQT